MTIKDWVESATNVRLCQTEGLQTRITLSDNPWDGRGGYLSQSEIDSCPCCLSLSAMKGFVFPVSSSPVGVTLLKTYKHLWWVLICLPALNPILLNTDVLDQWSPTFLAPGTGSMEDSFFHGLGEVGQGMVSGWFKCITFIVHFISITITLAPP